jgi:hypothetical protein
MSTEPAIGEEDERQKQSLADRLIPDRLMPNAARLAEAPLIDELTDSLDRTRKLLSGDPEGAAAAAMNRFSGEREVETRIALALSMNQPLAQPDKFPEAHRLAMRALEVLDREGFRRPQVPNLGPATVVAEYLVENVTEYIVKSYAQGIIGSLRRLYARREVQTAPNSPERRLLASARNEIDRIVPDFTGGGIGAPVLVAGGLLLPFLASLSQYLGAVDITDKVVQFGGIITAFVLFFVLSGVLLRGAAVAHRRSQLIMGAPLASLWETIGHAGHPPEDDSVTIAIGALVLAIVVWLVLPATALAIYLFA